MHVVPARSSQTSSRTSRTSRHQEHQELQKHSYSVGCIIMDELLEQGLVKRNDQLHSRIKELIDELNDIIIENGKNLLIVDRIEKSKPIFSRLKSLINEFEPSPKLLDCNLHYYIDTLSKNYLKLYDNVAPIPKEPIESESESESETDSESESDSETEDADTTIRSEDKIGNFVEKLKSNGSSPKLTSALINEESSYSLLSLATEISEVIYYFAKIRGFKFITNYFSSDVYLIPKLIKLITSNDLNDFENFFNLIWLSNLVLVPFPLSNISDSLSETIFKIGLRHLTNNSNASKTQLVSLILLSRLLTRDDSIKNNLLSNYFNQYVLNEWNPKTNSIINQHQSVDQNIKLGHMMTINKILKKISNDEVNKYIDLIYHQLIENDLIQLRIQINENLRFGKLSNLNILYIIKILSKLSKFYLINRNYNQVSKIINNLLNDIMNPMLDKFDTTLRYSMAKNLSNLTNNLSLQAINYQEQLIIYMIKQLNISNLTFDFSPFSNQSTKFNKFNPNLWINSNEISITKYHTILLYLAYTSLNKSLPKHLIPIIFSIVHKTLFISQKRVSANLGNQVRDSSCFIIWSLCRYLNKNDFENLSLNQSFLVENILFDLIKVIIFDHDLIIRRCGIAVLQEFVGRFGEIIFKPLLKSSNNDELGSFIIKFIEFFNNMSIGSLNLSYLIIGKLIKIGFPQKIFMPLILNNIINDEIPFSIKKLNSNHLINILQLNNENTSKEIEFQIDDKEEPDTIPIIKIIDTLINEVDRFNTGILNTGAIYSISELLAYVDINIIIDTYPQLIYQLDNFKFDFHHDTLEKGECYLKWINSCLGSNNYQILIKSDKLWSNLFSISRLKYDQSLVLEFKIFFELLKQNQIKISFENFNKLIYYIKNNNLIIAKSLIYYKFTDDNFLEILKLIENTLVDCDTRSLILKGLSDNLYVYELNEVLLLRLVNMLDDYTITNQGDVGSKIRISTLNLIQNNLKKFLETKIINELENKLIRLSGELIDKIKYESFKLLLKINSINDPQIYHVLEETNSNDANIYTSSNESEDPDHNKKSTIHLDDVQFYRVLLDYYYNHVLCKILLEDKYLDHYKNLSVNFWKGIVFSMGSVTGTNSIINESFNQVIRLVEKLNEVEKNYVFNELLKLLKIPPDTKLSELNSRQLKVYMMTLNLFVKLFESSIKFPVEFNYNTLFVRCYNLQINTSNITRIGLVLKNFQYLSVNNSLEKDFQLKCRNKVIFIACCCPLAKVRNMASEILFEIINELNPKDTKTIELLDTINWDKTPKDLKHYISQLEKVYKHL
ncbi:hypothetical protein HYPBUDRAFT_4343 [Hyphopichia burtonii NRRL Y-1933]|uniref:Tubulin-folding cofactor D ARM repeats domain-containing protein n=1 Tax=Hyphopichia burtonii NRRL Y-1933 TaxID=984485 RepID=A0A1E4RTB3_9ASCO|nr:hypothetical protein HYPBUDRAFT_4343 [Hyphopichia burtonii NRRL Y-1933]ODV70478.1 hypothetical protein HYPBUDRAFT_4343 [Hyphopichia burtonii NRRL Y-1933]